MLQKTALRASPAFLTPTIFSMNELLTTRHNTWKLNQALTTQVPAHSILQPIRPTYQIFSQRKSGRDSSATCIGDVYEVMSGFLMKNIWCSKQSVIVIKGDPVNGKDSWDNLPRTEKPGSLRYIKNCFTRSKISSRSFVARFVQDGKIKLVDRLSNWKKKRNQNFRNELTLLNFDENLISELLAFCDLDVDYIDQTNAI